MQSFIHWFLMRCENVKKADILVSFKEKNRCPRTETQGRKRLKTLVTLFLMVLLAVALLVVIKSLIISEIEKIKDK